jgi:hypothetical protein
MDWKTILIVNLIAQAIVFVYNFFLTYDAVYPGSAIAANISHSKASHGAFEAFIFILQGLLLGSIFYTVKRERERVRKWGGVWRIMAILIFAFLGTWQGWISFLVMIPLWQDAVWNNACQGWDMTAVIQGIS